ncbi:hypothetical protein P168DRAFT_326250 [Aspergillus campestris IBT 28561]|uniref:Flavin-nucleotide-binding protein n=1 Tax=Aspergillus campestris (strain IBT 28561) TaxID=1392248 RepID=A0A2I1D7U3_ASPC2|nr:uncharacterized protein P168DRAFT_326250 [Aspergillus campestris IBT 28561]PKY05951.1 hypothetical protein P168DRAFT_326250 [Aspergillus campestris IBT 28561]
MGRTLTYPKLPFNTVNRHNDRATYDLRTIHSIINTTQVLHVSFNTGSINNDNPFPAILPMIGAMGSFEYPSADINEPMDCYLHGYVSSRVMNLARAASASASTLPSAVSTETAATATATDKGLPVCIAASKLDGLILSLTPNSHSYNYRSAILHGHASLVTDEAEKLYAMRLMTDSVVTGRWAATRVPPDGAEMASTAVLRVRVVGGSGKIRDGGVSDERKDSADESVTGRVWTGVVPVWETFGEPVRDGDGRVGEVPGYLAEFVEGRNAENRAYAEGAVYASEQKD